MPRFNAVLAEASSEARQFHSGVKPRSRQSSISATQARVSLGPSVARPARQVSLAGRTDVSVEPEKVRRVVLSLQRHEPLVVTAG